MKISLIPIPHSQSSFPVFIPSLHSTVIILLAVRVVLLVLQVTYSHMYCGGGLGIAAELIETTP